MSARTKKIIEQVRGIFERRSLSWQYPRLIPLGNLEETDALGISLHKEAVSGTRRSLKKVLHSAIYVDYPNDKGQTPLFCACSRNNESTAFLLLQYGANPNEKSQDGITPTHAACYVGNVRLVGKLIEAGGDLRLHDNDGNSMRDWANMNKDGKTRLRMLQFLDKTHFYAMAYSGDAVNVDTFTKYARRPQKQTSIMEIMKIRTGSDTSFENLKRVHSMGFGKVYLGNDNSGGIISVIPLISENVLHVVRATRFDCGYGTFMEEMHWVTMLVTVKQKKTDVQGEEGLDLLITDAEYSGKIRHPNILLLMGICQSICFDSMMLVFEHVESSNLYHYLHKSGHHIQYYMQMTIIKHVCAAMEFIHNQSLIHCGLSSYAVYLVSETLVKVGNFEYMVESSKADLGKPSPVSSVAHSWHLYNWMAPELIVGQAPRFSSDIYGYCCMVWELFSGKIPWAGLEAHEIKTNVVENFTSLSISNARIPNKLRPIISYGLQVKEPERLQKFSHVCEWLKSDFSSYSQLPHCSKEWKDRSSNFLELSSSSTGADTECSAGENWTQDNLQFNQGFSDCLGNQAYTQAYHDWNLDIYCETLSSVSDTVDSFTKSPIVTMDKIHPISLSYPDNLDNNLNNMYERNNNGIFSYNERPQTLPKETMQSYSLTQVDNKNEHYVTTSVRKLTESFQQYLNQHELRQAIIKGSMVPNGKNASLSSSVCNSSTLNVGFKEACQISSQTSGNSTLITNSTPKTSILKSSDLPTNINPIFLAKKTLKDAASCMRDQKEKGDNGDKGKKPFVPVGYSQEGKDKLAPSPKKISSIHHRDFLREIKLVHDILIGKSKRIADQDSVTNSNSIEADHTQKVTREKEGISSLNANLKGANGMSSSKCLEIGHSENNQSIAENEDETREVNVWSLDTTNEYPLDTTQEKSFKNMCIRPSSDFDNQLVASYNAMLEPTDKHSETNESSNSALTFTKESMPDSEKVNHWIYQKLENIKDKLCHKASMPVNATDSSNSLHGLKDISSSSTLVEQTSGKPLETSRKDLEIQEKLMKIKSAQSIPEVCGFDFEFHEYYIDDDFGNNEKDPYTQLSLLDCNASTREKQTDLDYDFTENVTSKPPMFPKQSKTISQYFERNLAQAYGNKSHSALTSSHTEEKLNKVTLKTSLSDKDTHRRDNGSVSFSKQGKGSPVIKTREGVPAKLNGRSISECHRVGKSETSVSLSFPDGGNKTEDADDDTLCQIEKETDLNTAGLDDSIMVTCPEEISADPVKENKTISPVKMNVECQTTAVESNPVPTNDDSDSSDSDIWIRMQLDKIQKKIKRRKARENYIISSDEETSGNTRLPSGLQTKPKFEASHSSHLHSSKDEEGEGIKTLDFSKDELNDVPTKICESFSKELLFDCQEHSTQSKTKIFKNFHKTQISDSTSLEHIQTSERKHPSILRKPLNDFNCEETDSFLQPNKSLLSQVSRSTERVISFKDVTSSEDDKSQTTKISVLPVPHKRKSLLGEKLTNKGSKTLVNGRENDTVKTWLENQDFVGLNDVSSKYSVDEDNTMQKTPRRLIPKDNGSKHSLLSNVQSADVDVPDAAAPHSSVDKANKPRADKDHSIALDRKSKMIHSGVINEQPYYSTLDEHHLTLNFQAPTVKKSQKKKSKIGVHRFYIPSDMWSRGYKARLDVRPCSSDPDSHRVITTATDSTTGYTETLLDQIIPTRRLRSTLQID
ncbi:uncharacterized protein LOC131955028 isoform X2 [Physella acuta]|uniref:uncharacterized protein LOC131955028 isoform X2 n=1 Tax=Physella acuta TaxID=109671 RepID=UPI0027DD7210|nr:uncharacterized protein LOC131955028 isoform X2 [Physella acuta]